MTDNPVTGPSRLNTLSDSPCFTPGTLIATAIGEKPVEELAAGDQVITRDNGLQTVSWVGRARFDALELSRNPHLYPVLIRAGALGNGLPEQDLTLSPNHRVLVTSDQTALYFEEREVLVAAKHLVNHRGVFEIEALGVSYFHFLCKKHEVVMSNGCWSESFQPEDRSLKALGNAQREEIFEIFPGLKNEYQSSINRPVRRVLTAEEAALLFESS